KIMKTRASVARKDVPPIMIRPTHASLLFSYLCTSQHCQQSRVTLWPKSLNFQAASARFAGGGPSLGTCNLTLPIVDSYICGATPVVSLLLLMTVTPNLLVSPFSRR